MKKIYFWCRSSSLASKTFPPILLNEISVILERLWERCQGKKLLTDVPLCVEISSWLSSRVAEKARICSEADKKYGKNGNWQLLWDYSVRVIHSDCEWCSKRVALNLFYWYDVAIHISYRYVNSLTFVLMHWLMFSEKL